MVDLALMSADELDQLSSSIAKEKEERTKNSIKPLETPNWDNVIRQAEVALRLEIEHKDDKDSDHYMYEAVLEAVYGKDVFKRLRELGGN